MATPHEVRRLAFQALFQLDARGGGDADAVRATMEQSGDFSARERERAFTLALAAYAGRTEADALMEELAPEWPAKRQPAVDRAILRLAHEELRAGEAAVGVVLNEAVELAKEYGTEKSPPFVNALLDRAARRLRAAASGGGSGGAAGGDGSGAPGSAAGEGENPGAGSPAVD